MITKPTVKWIEALVQKQTIIDSDVLLLLLPYLSFFFTP
ncbi:MAG: hypothetical protein Ct9H90mP7_1040 [Candidatus Neomarinimicrobiota bacterium]|nr:MAG: hypothetical protein Ct9H90mP7_1040 [Candidatus Neomarinimicrobiota bacterium]